MQIIRRQKWPILAAAFVIALILIANLLLNSTGGASADQYISQGQKYLNDKNYSAAILQFTNAVQMDPTGRDARIGLSRAYTGMGEYAFAADVLDSVMDDINPDPEIVSALLEVFQASGNTSGQVSILETLIDTTDEDQYYQKMQELMAQLYSAPRSYASSGSHSLRVFKGHLQSQGSNLFGQLGTAQGLGDSSFNQSDFIFAGFSGTPTMVYCANRTSYVLDSEGNVWAAGENRYGQFGLGYGAILPESGWVQLTDSGDVISMAAVPGGLYVVRKDGTLWQAGVNGTQKLQPVQQFGHVVKLDAYGNSIYILDGQGDLYTFNARSGLYTLLRSGLADFSLNRGYVVGVTREGRLALDEGWYYPDGWEYENGTVQPGRLEPRTAVCNGSLLLILDTAGALYSIDRNGALDDVNLPSGVASLYAVNDTVVAELENGTIRLWAPGAISAQTMS